MILTACCRRDVGRQQAQRIAPRLNVPEDFDAALPEDVAMQFQSEAIEPSSENR